MQAAVDDDDDVVRSLMLLLTHTSIGSGRERSGWMAMRGVKDGSGVVGMWVGGCQTQRRDGNIDRSGCCALRYCGGPEGVAPAANVCVCASVLCAHIIRNLRCECV